MPTTKVVDELHEPNRSKFREPFIAAMLFVVGLAACWSGFGSEFWGNWMHSISFNLGVGVICVALGKVIHSAFPRLAVLKTAAVFGVIAVLFLWTYPGWLALHFLIHNIVN